MCLDPIRVILCHFWVIGSDHNGSLGLIIMGHRIICVNKFDPFIMLIETTDPPEVISYFIITSTVYL